VGIRSPPVSREAGPATPPASEVGIQVLVSLVVTAAFATIYITQPVLPILEREFGVGAGTASLTVSAVILGIAISNLPFGVAADRYPIRRIIIAGGLVVSGTSLVCAMASSLPLLVAARFVQGLFIPSMSTCLAAYLARTVRVERLDVVMGAYVSASVTGGLGGRLLGGFIVPAERWRMAFVIAAVLLLGVTFATARLLPREEAPPRAEAVSVGFVALLRRPALLRMFAVGFSGFFVFSAMFNYMPFHLSGPPLNASIRVVTLLYLTYVVGIVIGPVAGKIAGRLGAGATLVCGSALFAGAIALTLVPSLVVTAVSLAGLCAGFFGIHAAAVGALNRRVAQSRGRANSLYVLLYYLGGAAGISATGAAYVRAGWTGAVVLGLVGLLVPLGVGLFEIRAARAA
jgi:YNFM family putative membrane transporter